MGHNQVAFRCSGLFLTGIVLLIKVNGFGMRPKGPASSFSFNLLTSSLDLFSSSSGVAATERNVLAFIRSCTGATSNAALGCPCAGNGKRCKNPLSICRNFKCICDPTISTYNSTSNKCVAAAGLSGSASNATTPRTTTMTRANTTTSRTNTTTAPATNTSTTNNTSASTCTAKIDTAAALPVNVNNCSGTATDTFYPIRAGVTATNEILDILNTHNNYRRSVAATNMQKLQWSACAASSAQNWADTCPTGHDANSARTNPGFSYCGQNIAWNYADWKSATKGWYDEVKDFRYGTAPTGVVGHFTQIMWADTGYIGCGIKTCGPFIVNGLNFPAGTPVYICNYCTGGNILTANPNSLYIPWKTADSTTKCTQCPAGTRCATGDCLCAKP